MAIDTGLSGTAELTVTAADTAAALGSGDVPVLGTPRVLALAEAATVAALDGHLDDGRTTVGTEVRLAHTAPTPVGARVTATAHLALVEGRRLVFEVAVVQGDRRVAAGTVERVVVDRERFLSGVRREGE
ncbi:thioesterase family protein [Thermobifida cellulosilytica]|uniref:Thioesterase n=1 Tax=Thermobifida cellulosilytica TB100 TaxID=665004 RepID=A0A147KGY1_THECS|nr:hotdog domain-containing protein [Thermobifida cellulosilytica]KUP96555.1 thioesterase [Thermobifida cellulosilytica TB100]